MRNTTLIIFSLTFVVFSLFSCKEESSQTPKPRSYPRVVYPEKKYVPFDTSFCEFTFEYPAYATIVQDTSFFGEKPEDACWFNIYVPEFQSLIFCTYYPLGKKNTLNKVVNDAYKLAGVHNKKANFIDEIPVKLPDNVSGTIFEIEGPVASTYQFFLTDSTKHFLRGALYFNVRTNQDSLAPVVDFMKKDVVHMINTFKWKK
jgi:gliding motility-associated lipoprotein GldD